MCSPWGNLVGLVPQRLWGVQGLSSMKLLFTPLLATASNDTLKKI